MAKLFLQVMGHLDMSDTTATSDLIRTWIGQTFPDVEPLATEVLQTWMEVKPGELIILDTRSAAEFDVSHLPGAIRVDPDRKDLSELLQQHLSPEGNDAGRVPREEIVCYCTVGYRSSSVARALSAGRPSGARRVYNVDGGLVKWASESRRMEDSQGRATQFIHPGNAVWARAVRPELRAWM
ncbi:uncharacterized protein LOC100681627 isoform X2 [Ornithorhynchus anatinus]|uniref:uncharacterized protein LOC100681627 isoform X2 n=1 Tax=Ornithorhynchus anatinus TaxID=9258 RepID=UPI0010A781E2|nr:uncharacterized protein LOC100681627 isoform X2 [Ornithorhynchus anatinus]